MNLHHAKALTYPISIESNFEDLNLLEKLVQLIIYQFKLIVKTIHVDKQNALKLIAVV